MFKVFSIGPGNGRAESFVDRLKRWNIECLVDLRSEPYSQYVPQFNRERLSSTIKNEKIDYLYYGDRLGGRPQGGFEQYRSSPEFKENINLLLNKIENKTVALMCSEFDISKCHRRFIVEEIVRKGIDVMIIDKEGNATKYAIDVSKKLKHLKAELDSKSQSKLTAFGDNDNE